MHWMKHRWLLILPLLLVVLASCSSPAASTPQPTAFSPSPDANKLSADGCTRDESFSKGMGRLSLGRDVDWTIFCLGRNGARGACVYRHAGLSWDASKWLVRVGQLPPVSVDSGLLFHGCQLAGWRMAHRVCCWKLDGKTPGGR
jgi:hypothetical protein